MAHVQVAEITPFKSYTVTSATAGPFTIPADWAFFDIATDLRVFNDGTELTYAVSPSDATEFSVSGTAVDEGFEGGTFTLGGTVENTTITLQRDVPIARTEDFPYPSPTLNIKALNTALDKIATWAQQFKLLFERSIRLPDGDSSATLTLPVAAERANKILAFDANGNVDTQIANSDTYISASAFSLAAFASATASAWRTALGLVIGTDVLAPDGDGSGLTGIATVNSNLVINPDFQQWQYGTSFTPSGSASVISADAWAVRRGTAANYTVARQGSAGGYSIRVQRDSATSDTNQITLAHVIRSINAQGFFIDADQDVTLSFSAKKGANYSAASNYLVSRFWTGTGADQGAASMLTGGWTGSANDTQSNTLTTSFQTFTHTHTVPQNTTELGFDFGVTPVGTAGADDWFEIEWVKIEIGSSNTTFETPDYEDNLRACQTRKELIREATTAFSASTTSVTFAFNFKTTKHTDTPTIVLEDTSPAVQLVTGAPTGSSSAIASTVSRNRDGCAINVNGFTGLTGGEPGASRNGSGVLISVEDD